ncbi:anion transporter [Veillonella sp. R32]|nr:DASS family sodium-coupled anion symporter [Veillonella sp. R32]KAF1682054.1 anion transporter [Veillonella sp. R32]
MKKDKKEKSMLRRIIELVSIFLIYFLITLLPLPEGLSLEGLKALGMFVTIILMWALEPVPLPMVSFVFVPFVIFTGMMKLGPALGSFANSSIFLIIAALMMSPAMEKTGLAERSVYVLLSKIGCTATRMVIGITIANIILAFLIPSTAARTATLLPVCLAIIELYKKQSNIEGRNNFAIGLLLTLGFTNSIISSGILTATVPNPIVVSFIAQATGQTISYGEWLMYGFPPALIMAFFATWFIRLIYKPECNEIPGGVEYIKKELAERGRMSMDEWKTAIIFLIVVLLWLTGSLTGINTTVAAIIGVILIFIANVVTWKDVSKTSGFQFMMIMAGGFIIAELLLKTGAAKWLAMTLFSMLNIENVPIVALIIVVMAIIQYLHIPFMGTTK